MQNNNHITLSSLITKLGGLSVIVSVLSFFYYALYVKLKYEFWGHPLEYVNIVYFDVISDNASYLLYLFPTIFVFGAILELFLEGKVASPTNINNQEKIRYLWVHILILILFITLAVFLFNLGIFKFLYPIVIASTILILLVIENLTSKDKLTTETFNKRKSVYGFSILTIVLTTAIPILIYYSSINPVFFWSDKTQTLQVIEISENPTDTAIKEYYYFVAEKNNNQIWRKFISNNNPSVIALTNEFRLFNANDLKDKTIHLETFKLLDNSQEYEIKYLERIERE